MKLAENDKKYVLASANPDKVRELRDILTKFGLSVASRQELGVDIEIEETGETFADNAAIKAKAICEATGLPSIADDSGLLVDALGGGPGLFTSTFGGDGLDNEGRCRYLLETLEGAEHRGAKFVSAIVCAFPDGSFITAQGECRGSIPDAPRGTGGFGYDPVFMAEGTGMTMAELPLEKKHEISHRGKALKQFAQLLQDRFPGV